MSVFRGDWMFAHQLSMPGRLPRYSHFSSTDFDSDERRSAHPSLERASVAYQIVPLRNKSQFFAFYFNRLKATLNNHIQVTK